MLVDKDQIAQYLPQSPPFIMVDQLLEASPKRISTRFWVRKDNVFVEEGRLREFALIENLAQSSAAGLAFHRMSSGEISMTNIEGFLVGLTQIHCFQLPEVNNCLDTVLEPLHTFGNLIQLWGQISVGQQVVLEGKIKLAGMRTP